MKINCLSCGCIEATAEDGMICVYREIEGLEDFLDIETMFCKEYKYNECLECESENCEDYKYCKDNKIYCDECNELMEDGYIIHDGLCTYCSEKCLHKNISKVDYEKLYDMGFAFWTTFED